MCVCVAKHNGGTAGNGTYYDYHHQDCCWCLTVK